MATLQLQVGVVRPSASASRSRASGQQFGSGRSELVRAGRPVAPGLHALSNGTRPTGVACGATGAQMNLFSRMGRVVKSYANQLVSSAEDPEKILDQAVRDMQEDLIKMRQAAAQVIASQKQLEMKQKQAATAADEWYRRAELALGKGEEALAKEALKRRKDYQTQADQWKAQIDGQRNASEQMIANTRILESKLSEAKSKKDTLKARAASAKTSKEVNEMLSSVGTSSAYAAFERMEEKVMTLEAESEAIAELPGVSGATGDDLDRKFAMLEGDDVDSELSKMKNKLASGEKKSELPAGRPISEAMDPIDAELEALRKRAQS